MAASKVFLVLLFSIMALASAFFALHLYRASSRPVPVLPSAVGASKPLAAGRRQPVFQPRASQVHSPNLFQQLLQRVDHSSSGTCVVTVDIVRPNHSYLARSTVRRSIQNKEAYCKKWGYSFHVLHDEVLPVDATATKTLCLYKVHAISRQLPKCKWLFWLDLDTLITNFDIPLEPLLDDQYDILAAGPASTNHSVRHLNAGAMIFQNTNWTLSWLLPKVIEIGRKHRCSGSDKIKGEQDFWIKALAGQEKHWKLLEWQQINVPVRPNSIGVWKRGDFVAHYWGGEKKYMFNDDAWRYMKEHGWA